MANPIRNFTDQEAENITRVEELTYELKVEEVMTKDPCVVTPETKMNDLLEIFRKNRISGTPVVVNQQLAGIVSIEDLIRCLQCNDLSSPVSKYMSTKLLTTRNTDPVIEALKLFVSSHYGRLPVLNEQGQLGGNHHKRRYHQRYPQGFAA